MGILVFNGISSKDLGVVVQAPPVYEFPSKRYDVVQIEGKNGDVVIDKKSFNNVNREYNLASVFRRNETFVSSARSFVDWLSTVNGYARLEDTYEPEYFRLAVFRSGGQLPNLYDKATGMTVRFECKPQRYLKSGENPIILKGTTTYVRIYNDTQYIAEPEITVNGTITSIEVIKGNDQNGSEKTIYTYEHLTKPQPNKFVIDSELQDVYTDTEYINDASRLTNGFPKLYPGENLIKVTTTNSNAIVSIKPRWWVL